MSNQNSASFYGNFYGSSNLGTCYTLSFPITKKFIFVLIAVSNQTKLYFLRTYIFQIRKIKQKTNRKKNDQKLFVVKIGIIPIYVTEERKLTKIAFPQISSSTQLKLLYEFIGKLLIFEQIVKLFNFDVIFKE